MGDIGTKLGMNANDTGYLILKDLKVPREFMLCKFGEVQQNG